MLAVLVTALCAVAASHNARAATVIHANDTLTQADIVSYPETVEYYANALDVDTLVRKRAAVSSASSVMRLRALFEREIFARAACRLSADRRHRREIFKIAREKTCLLYTSPSPRDLSTSRMPSSA